MGAGAAQIGGGALKIGAGMWQIRAGREQKAAYYQSAQILKSEGLLAATQALNVGTIMREEGAAFIGTQKVAYAKSGVMLEGSPLAVLVETATQTERDAMLAREQGKLEQIRYAQQADIQRKTGHSIGTAATAQGFSTIVGGGTDMMGGMSA